MQGADIANRIKEIIGYYTDDFSDILSIASLSRSGSTITAVTSSSHGLNTGDYTTIRGAKEPISLTSITREGDIATVTSATDHKLSDPSLYSNSQLPIYIQLAGNNPSAYNGIFELLTVIDDATFTFKITSNPPSPASIAGFLLLEDFDGYNGFKQITKIDDTTFTYITTNTNLKTPAQGNLELTQSTRVDHSATAERILDFYDANSSGILQNWMFIVVNGKQIYKNDTIANDSSSAQRKNQSYWYEGQQDFSIYVIIPSKTSILGGVEADLARSYEKPILAAVANYIFDSVLSEEKYQPVVYTGNEEDDYIKAYYVHRFDFSAKDFVQQEDTSAFNNGVPLELVDGTIIEKGMTFRPNFRNS